MYERYYLAQSQLEEVFKKIKSDNFTVKKSDLEIIDVNIIVPDKVIEATFADGTKQKAVCSEPDTFSLEQGIAICISKKLIGGSSKYNKAIKDGLKVYQEKIKNEEFEKEERARISRKRAKRITAKKRRAEKLAKIEREKQIEIQKEAYVRAMKELKGGIE